MVFLGFILYYAVCAIVMLRCDVFKVLTTLLYKVYICLVCISFLKYILIFISCINTIAYLKVIAIVFYCNMLI